MDLSGIEKIPVDDRGLDGMGKVDTETSIGLDMRSAVSLTTRIRSSANPRK